MENKKLKKSEIKKPKKVVLLYAMCGLISMPLLVVAEGLSTSMEAVLPFSQASTDNPPLFDVISEPAQSIPDSTISPVVFSVIIKILLILLVIFVVRKIMRYFMAQSKLKEKINT